MQTLAQTLGSTTPVSVLLRKARRLGLRSVDSLVELAISRGCRHYSSGPATIATPPSQQELGDDELTILLIIGENAYDPVAIRCAGQLARSPRVDPLELVRLAVMEKAERVLAHIARAGIAHDAEGGPFWKTVLDRLPNTPPRNEPNLPHWTRFVSMPGRQRSGIVPPRWLVPCP